MRLGGADADADADAAASRTRRAGSRRAARRRAWGSVVVVLGPSRLRAGLLSVACAATLVGVLPPASAGAEESPAPNVTPTGEAPAPHAPGDPVGGLRLGETGTVVEPVPGLPAIPQGLQAKSWIVADLDTGAVLAARDPHRRNRPASTLKTLTALTLIPQLDLGGRATFTAAQSKDIKQDDGLSTAVGLEVGRAYPINRLFEAMLVVSANDAAETLAAAEPGGRAGTLAAMNAEAAHLQARDTLAGTPSGLDAAGQYTSAYDLALIARAALALPDFRTWTKAANVALIGSKGVFGGYNHNRLLNSYQGAYAGKDGYTKLAGQVWWGAAERGGRHLFVAVVDAGFGPVSQEISLLNWGFAAAPVARPVGQLVDPIPPGGLPAPAATAAPAPGSGLPGAALAGATAARGARGREGLGIPWRWAGLVVLLVALGVAFLRRRALARSRPEGPRGPTSRHRGQTRGRHDHVPVAASRGSGRGRDTDAAMSAGGAAGPAPRQPVARNGSVRLVPPPEQVLPAARGSDD